MDRALALLCLVYVCHGKTNYFLRALRDKGLVKRGKFSQNADKLQHTLLLIPKGIAQKLSLATRFLQRKEREFKELRYEIARLHTEIGDSNPNPVLQCRHRADLPKVRDRSTGLSHMRKQTIRMQIMATQVSVRLMGGCTEEVTATEISLAAIVAES